MTLILGDCLDVMGGMADGSINSVVCDPPYGAKRPSARRKGGNKFGEIQGNDRVHPEWLKAAYRVLADCSALYLFTTWQVMEEWRTAMTSEGFKVRSLIVWDKCVHGLADLQTCWAPQHEFILYAAKGRHILRKPRPKDVIRVPRLPSTQLLHPYQKPVDVITPLILASTDPGQVVLDPFAGSGSTGLACQQLGRDFYGIEKEMKYFETAQTRLAKPSSPVGGV